MITKRQKEVLSFLESYQAQKGYAPSLEDIRRHLRVASVSTAHFHIEKLKEAGHLSKRPNQPRAIGITNHESMIQIPLLGTVAAGSPIEAIVERETIAVPKNQIPTTGNLFALRVSGDSMREENIENGDIVILKEQAVAENGERVVALINGDSATLKTFHKERGQISLLPANKNYEPIVVGKSDRLDIQGVLVSVLKKTTDELSEGPSFGEKTREGTSAAPTNKIICGDVIQELRKLPKESFDAIIIDPPYNIGKDFGNNIDRRDLQDYVSWSKEWINESIRTLKPNGTIFIYGFSEILAYLSVEIPLPKRWLIWHYTNKNVASVNFWQRSHEAILCVWKEKPLFNRDAVREPYTETFLANAAGKVRAGTPGRFSKGGVETVYRAHENGALPRDVIKVPALAGGAGLVERWFLCKTCGKVYPPKAIPDHRDHDVIKHPTHKPLELTKRLLKSCLPQDNPSVLVPFAGTGSECVAARDLGATYLGVELNPDYVELANGFLKQTAKKLRFRTSRNQFAPSQEEMPPQ